MSKQILLERKEEIPQISFVEDMLMFEGKAYPEDALEFQKVVKDIIQGYLEERKRITLMVDMVYLNSSSIKVVYDLIRHIILHTDQCIVHWIYDEDDEDMFDEGEIIKEQLLKDPLCENFEFTYEAKQVLVS